MNAKKSTSGRAYNNKVLNKFNLPLLSMSMEKSRHGTALTLSPRAAAQWRLVINKEGEEKRKMLFESFMTARDICLGECTLRR